MQNARERFLSSAIVIIAVVCLVGSACAASIGQRDLELSNFDTDKEQVVLRLQRQAIEPEDSVEDSDEDDDEDDVEQFQQSLAQQQSFQDFAERDEADDEDDEGDDRRRRRRDLTASENQQTAEPIMATVPKPVESMIENPSISEEKDKKQPEQSENKVESVPIVPVVPPVEAIDKPQEAVTESESAEGILPTGSTAAQPTRKTPVLILIRDALKKVTAGLPTEQVATNALQYFQLFEHFLQQAIEQVIGDDDDEDEEATTVKFEPEAEPELVNKVPEAEASQSTPAVEESANASNANSEGDKKETVAEPAKETATVSEKEPDLVKEPADNKPSEELTSASTPSNSASSMPADEIALNVL